MSGRAIAAGTRSPFAQRDFRLLFAGQATSMLGDGIVPIAVAFAVFDLTGSATSLGLVLAAGSVPTVLFVLVGGVWADRLPRRKVMLVSDCVRALTQLLLGLLLITGSAALWHFLVLNAIWGTAAAFFRPAWTGALPEIVPTERLQQANGLFGLSRNIGSVAGPSLGGVLIAGAGVGTAFLVDAATFLVSALTIAVMSKAPAPRETTDRTSMLHDLRTGWTDFVSRRWLVAVIVWAALFHFAVLAPYQVLGPEVALRSLGGAVAWGAISAGFGAGSVAGALLIIRFRVRRQLVVACLSLLTFALPLALLALAAPAALVAVTAFTAGAGVSVFSVLFSTVMQQRIPLTVLSRVSAYDWMGSLALLPLGLAVVGPLADLTSGRTVLFSGAVVTVVSTAAVLCVPGVREPTAGPGPAVPNGTADEISANKGVL